MLSSTISSLLVVAGTVLMAVVIFAPVRAARAVTISCAPPLPAIDAWDASDAFASPFERPLLVSEPPRAEPPALWPLDVDAAAACAGEDARRALIDALSDVRAAWADAILARAAETDPSGSVREAAVSALRRAPSDQRP
ncbi:MAG TPA: hypothetical protein VHT53_03105 [Candidatus Elarobacter sp.]|nr:hypothetical protein [Candidatus Elarobacter sp.]